MATCNNCSVESGKEQLSIYLTIHLIKLLPAVAMRKYASASFIQTGIQLNSEHLENCVSKIHSIYES